MGGRLLGTMVVAFVAAVGSASAHESTSKLMSSDSLVCEDATAVETLDSCYDVCNGGSATCSLECEYGGVTMTCSSAGFQCTGGYCQTNYVENYRTQVWRVWEKDFGWYCELWSEQIINETDVSNCNEGTRNRCDPYMIANAFGSADCCDDLGYACFQWEPSCQ
jgi:hypothetical protein